MSEEVKDPIALFVAKILMECKDARWRDYCPPRVVAFKRLSKQ